MISEWLNMNIHFGLIIAKPIYRWREGRWRRQSIFAFHQIATQKVIYILLHERVNHLLRVSSMSNWHCHERHWILFAHSVVYNIGIWYTAEGYVSNLQLRILLWPERSCICSQAIEVHLEAEKCNYAMVELISAKPFRCDKQLIPPLQKNVNNNNNKIKY